MLKRHSQFIQSIVLLVDIAIVAISWTLSYYQRFSNFWWADYGNNHSPVYYFYLLLPIIFAWPFIFKNMGLYRPRRVSSIYNEVFDIIKASTLAVLILVTATYFASKDTFSRLVFFYFWVASIVLLAAERLVIREILWYFRRKGYNTRRVLIVGAGKLGGRVVSKVKENPWTGLDIVGYLDDHEEIGSIVEGEKVIGKISNIVKTIETHNVDQVFIALPVSAHKRLMYIVESLKNEMVTIKVIPDIYQALTLNAGVEEFEGMPLINLMESPMYGWCVIVKRTLDITFSLCAILVTAPVMLMTAFFVKLTSPGPILYKQERMGLDGKIFNILKFRSMNVDAEGATGAVWAESGDSRRTRLGTFLRRTSIDELPQFFNVLKGDMSIVGPRPERPVFIKEFKKEIPKYMLRHKVKAGITGWAQVNGWRGNTCLEKRIECDIYYIENWSLWFDIKIMWLTIWKGMVHKHAY